MIWSGNAPTPTMASCTALCVQTGLPVAPQKLLPEESRCAAYKSFDGGLSSYQARMAPRIPSLISVYGPGMNILFGSLTLTTPPPAHNNLPAASMRATAMRAVGRKNDHDAIAPPLPSEMMTGLV